MNDKTKMIECDSCYGAGEHWNPDDEERHFNPTARATCMACDGVGKVPLTDDMITVSESIYKIDQYGEPVLEYCEYTEEEKPVIVGHRDVRARYVGVYVITRNYGGSEEGGWWYNTSEHEFSIPLTQNGSRSDYDKVVAFLKERYEGEGNIYSASGGYEYEFRAELTQGQFENTRRPSYS